MSDPIIQVKHLTKNYKIPKIDKGLRGFIQYLFRPESETRAAIQDLSFEVNRGEMIGYLGPNGAGKSTTVKLLTGLLKPTSGTVHVFGRKAHLHRRELAQKTGVLMGQRSQLWWDLPVQDSFEMLRRIYDIPESEHRQWLKELVELVEIEELLRQPVRLLSLGQRMRAEIVATFLHRPELVYLDEPTIGLDVITKRKILDFLIHLNEQYGTTIILTTHDIPDVEKVCRRMLLLNHGRLQYDGSVQAFVKGFCNKRRVILETLKGHHPNLPDDFQLIERHVDRWEYLYDTDKWDEQRIMGIISEVGNIRDISFRDLELTHVIRLWYEEKKEREA